MNIRFSGFSNSLQSLNRRQSLTNILLNKQNVGQSGKKDLFVRSTTYDAGTYTISAGIPGGALCVSGAPPQCDLYAGQYRSGGGCAESLAYFMPDAAGAEQRMVF